MIAEYLRRVLQYHWADRCDPSEPSSAATGRCRTFDVIAAAAPGAWAGASAPIRHVIEKSSETTGSKTFRYDLKRPMGNLLKNPRFPKAIQVLT